MYGIECNEFSELRLDNAPYMVFAVYAQTSAGIYRAYYDSAMSIPNLFFVAYLYSTSRKNTRWIKVVAIENNDSAI